MAHNKKNTKQPQRFWRGHATLGKWLLSVLAGLSLLAGGILAWFSLSPWPGAMIIRWEFEQNGAKTTAALQKHAPAGIATQQDLHYIPGNKDALLDVYTPQSAVDNKQLLPVVIWTHGGAWLSGSKSNSAPYYKLLAQAGYTVIAPNYSLAPDMSYPVPIHQLNAAHQYIVDNAAALSADVGNIVLAGDSAGSQLSAQMAALITSPAYAQEVGIVPALKPQQLKGTVLTCGIYKMEALADPTPELSKLLSWGDNVTVWAYSGTNDFSKPVIRQMSPFYHITQDFPPSFITGGNGDPLTNTQSKPLADALQSLGVEVDQLFYEPGHAPALPHEYQFNLDTPDGQAALQRIIGFLHNHTR